MGKFYYRYGEVETEKPWISPPPIDRVNEWWCSFKEAADLEEYNVFVGGKYVIDPANTKDVDILLIGPIYDYNNLHNIFKTGLDLALNKHQIYVDIKHYDNICFFYYPRREDFVRLHQVTEMAGEEIKIVNDVIEYQGEKEKSILHKSIPDNIAVNMQEIPYPKHIKDGRRYNPLKLH